MISKFLKEISGRNKGVNHKKYIDSNGDIYLGQPDGRLLLSQPSNIYNKEQVNQIASSGGFSGGGSGGSVTNITNIYYDGDIDEGNASSIYTSIPIIDEGGA